MQNMLIDLEIRKFKFGNPWIYCGFSQNFVNQK